MFIKSSLDEKGRLHMIEVTQNILSVTHLKALFVAKLAVSPS